jgi:hypothetical protein
MQEGVNRLVQLYLENVTVPEYTYEDTLVEIERRLETFVQKGYITSREGTKDITAYREQLTQSRSDEVYFFEYADIDDLEGEKKSDYYRTLIGHPRQFQLFVPPRMPERHINSIEDIIESERPVYTDANVRQLENRFRLGGPTFLGINTVYPTEACQLGNKRLGEETRLDGTTS